jgi:hypothetical protein
MCTVSSNRLAALSPLVVLALVSRTDAGQIFPHPPTVSLTFPSAGDTFYVDCPDDKYPLLPQGFVTNFILQLQNHEAPHKFRGTVESFYFIVDGAPGPKFHPRSQSVFGPIAPGITKNFSKGAETLIQPSDPFLLAVGDHTVSFTLQFIYTQSDPSAGIRDFSTGSVMFHVKNRYDSDDPMCPEPASFVLLGIGVCGVAGYSLRRRVRVPSLPQVPAGAQLSH